MLQDEKVISQTRLSRIATKYMQISEYIMRMVNHGSLIVAFNGKENKSLE
jgi:hypothetical protein